MDEKRLNELRKYSTIIRRHIIEAVYNANLDILEDRFQVQI